MPIKIPASQNTASYQPSCTGPNHTSYVPNARTFSGTTFTPRMVRRRLYSPVNINQYRNIEPV